MLVEIVATFLIEDNHKKDITQQLINNHNARFRYKITLKTGETIYPDIVNASRKVVYEIHVKGERRGNYFGKLPDGWKGINVFYDEEDNPETMVVKFVTNEVQIIKWQGIERYEKYNIAIKPHIQSLKERIKNEGGEIVIPVDDLLGMFGMSKQTPMYGIKYVLFSEGIVFKIAATTLQRVGQMDLVCIMRERVESDTLPASLITEDDSAETIQ
jgi:hypothetical protein